ncbi:redoxin domain-containing protein [Verrucomicrobium sp. BvORR034]|uniref:redoxin domain-containing protein n=1 Tax=Verrucomicrobium sp. BvORR034 TaxID=1396418 RepID=UPI000679B41A|nr:redoxin domain-containing protein [Verrucomicrobium sp. BvORR034]
MPKLRLVRGVVFHVSLAVCTVGALADDPLPNHGSHQGTFRGVPYEAAVLTPGTGRVHFPISSADPRAQKFFEQGVGLLHGFGYFEAERSFKQVILLDRNCAMGYWGCAMANWSNVDRARSLIAEAARRQDGATEREKAWIQAGVAYFSRDASTKRERWTILLDDLEEISRHHPEDLEAKAFYVWAAWRAREDRVQGVNTKRVEQRFAEIFEAEPEHPAHHYFIHWWDGPQAARGLPSVDVCGPSAAAIAHMWHMPGHIFTRLNRYAEAAWHQEAATRVDHAWLLKSRILPDQIHNYAHNSDWLIRSLVRLGRAGEAMTIARNLIEIPRHPSYNTPQRDRSTSAYGQKYLWEIPLQFELWDDVLALEGSPYLDAGAVSGVSVERWRALGVAAFFKGDESRLRQCLARLQDQPPATSGATEGSRSQVAKAPAAAATKRRKTALSEDPPEDRAAPAIAELRALVAMNEQQDAKVVLDLLGRSNDIPKERLLRYHLLLEETSQALVLSKQLDDDVIGLHLKLEAVLAFQQQGEAKVLFEKLRHSAAMADENLPAIRRLESLAGDWGMSGNWRIAPGVEGTRKRQQVPESMGPLYWKPASAAHLRLTDALGKPVDILEEHAGRPFVLIFHLGSDCAHCVEQLQGFTAVLEEYQKLGVDLVVVGSQPSLKAESPDKATTMTLFTDPGLEQFKAWRCFDDFENQPLHGTFLVDGKGNVRWWDVGRKPFSNARFLLEEGRRLLRW